MLISRKLFASLVITAMAGLGAYAQSFNLSASSPKISENFDSMWDAASSQATTTLPEGWKIDKNMTAPRQVCAWNDADNTVMYTQSENLLSNQSNGTYCFGATADNSDRAIGGLTTGSVGGANPGTRGINVMTGFTNTDPSKIITNLDLSYAIEKYRNGNNNAGFSIRLFTSKDGEKWQEAGDAFVTSFDPDSETLGAAVVPISTQKLENLNLRTHVEPGKTLFLAWNISVTSGTTCSSAPGYAVDDIVIEAIFADSDPDWEEEETPDFVASGIYLRGINGVWTPSSPEWEFSKLSETEYALYNKTISGSFKVADSSWSSNCNYGSNGSNIIMGEAYELKSGSEVNISCGSMSFNCSRILLTIEEGTATLLLEPNTSTIGLTSVYMVGDFNDWNYMSKAGCLNLDPSDNLFKGEIGLTAGEDGLSHWMIYQRLALAGAWGLSANAVSATDKGTLTAGLTGHVATEPGMYEVSFNISTGEYTLSLMPSKAQKAEILPAKTTLVPQIPEVVKVLSLNNSLIHYNDQARVFNDIASAMNKNANWTKHTNLGKTLQYHWEEGDGMTEAGEPGAKMMVRSDTWSHIILQEQTILPRTDFESFRNSVLQWVDYIRENCPNPNAVIILPLNWALAQDWSNFSDYNKTLVDNYTKLAQEAGLVVCPVGIAYQNKYNNDGGNKTEAEWFLPGDDRHPTLKATYLAALMEYALIFNEDPETVSYYPSYTTEYDLVGEMNNDIAAQMRKYASEALQQYQNVVDHHNSSINLKAAVYDQFGLEMNAGTPEWSVSPSTASVDNGVFSATEPGEYNVTLSIGDLQATSVITVAEPVTVMEIIPFISFSEDNLSYFQNFDSMGNDEEAIIPEGWKADGQVTERTVGSYREASSTTLKAGGTGFGSSAKNGVWNLGDSSDETDRALGGITTDTAGGAKSINVYTALKNEGSKYLSSFDIEYDIERYRDGSNAAGFAVQLYTSLDGKKWISAGDDFNTYFEPQAETIGSETVPMETRHMVATLNFEMAPGAELYLAWNISAASGQSCMSAPVLAIDNVSLEANVRPLPVFDYYIYVENLSSYDKTALYAWSENEPSEIFGPWPGLNPIEVVAIDGVDYLVFGHNQATGKYHLIFNNNNNGAQYDDFDVEAGKNYYLRANPDDKTMMLVTTAVKEIEDSISADAFKVDDNSAYCEGALSITVFNLSGAKMIATNGDAVDLSQLSPGIYLLSASTASGNISKKILKK